MNSEVVNVGRPTVMVYVFSVMLGILLYNNFLDIMYNERSWNYELSCLSKFLRG